MIENKTPPMVMQTINDEKIRPVGRFPSGTTPCKVGTHIKTAGEVIVGIRGGGRGGRDDKNENKTFISLS